MKIHRWSRDGFGFAETTDSSDSRYVHLLVHDFEKLVDQVDEFEKWIKEIHDFEEFVYDVAAQKFFRENGNASTANDDGGNGRKSSIGDAVVAQVRRGAGGGGGSMSNLVTSYTASIRRQLRQTTAAGRNSATTFC